MFRSTKHSRSFPEFLEEGLRVDADAAIELHRIAREEFWEVCSLANNGDMEGLREAATRQNVTRKALVAALIRLNDFIRHGIIPEDLRKPQKSQPPHHLGGYGPV
jgi:hypothetical protein